MINERELVDKLHEASDVAKKIWEVEKEIGEIQKKISKLEDAKNHPVATDGYQEGRYEQDAHLEEAPRYKRELAAAYKKAGKKNAAKSIPILLLMFAVQVLAFLVFGPIASIIAAVVFSLTVLCELVVFSVDPRKSGMRLLATLMNVGWLILSVLAFFAMIGIIDGGGFAIRGADGEMQTIAIPCAKIMTVSAVSFVASIVKLVVISKRKKVEPKNFSYTIFECDSELIREAKEKDKAAAKAHQQHLKEVSAAIEEENKPKIAAEKRKLPKLNKQIEELNKEMDAIIVLPPEYKDYNKLGRLLGYVLTYKQEYNGYPYSIDAYISYVEWKEQEREWKNEQARREAVDSIVQTFADMQKRQEDEMRRRSVERDLAATRRELEDLNKKLDQLK